MGPRLQVVSIFHEEKKTHPKSLIPDFCPAKLSELTARLFAWLGLATESKVPLIVDLEALRIRGCCFFSLKEYRWHKKNVLYV